MMALLVGASALFAPNAHSADITVREIATAIHAAQGQAPVNFTGRDMSGLDLAGLDLKSALLAGANFNATDLTGVNLSSADLTAATLDRSTLIKADLSGARMTRATLTMPAVSTTFDINASDAPNFAGADLSNARILVRFEGVNFRGANLTQVDFRPHESSGINPNMLRTALIACNFAGANLAGAKLVNALLTFSDLSGTDLRGADLTNADLVKVNLSGAKLAGANFTGALLDEANFTGATGMETAIGLILPLAAR